MYQLQKNKSVYHKTIDELANDIKWNPFSVDSSSTDSKNDSKNDSKKSWNTKKKCRRRKTKHMKELKLHWSMADDDLEKRIEPATQISLFKKISSKEFNSSERSSKSPVRPSLFVDTRFSRTSPSKVMRQNTMWVSALVQKDQSSSPCSRSEKDEQKPMLSYAMKRKASTSSSDEEAFERADIWNASTNSTNKKTYSRVSSSEATHNGNEKWTLFHQITPFNQAEDHIGAEANEISEKLQNRRDSVNDALDTILPFFINTPNLGYSLSSKPSVPVHKVKKPRKSQKSKLVLQPWCREDSEEKWD